MFSFKWELNFAVADATKCLERVKSFFESEVSLIQELDGLSMSFENWRFNLRRSNTEPLVRLNVEAIADQSLLEKKINELKQLIT